MPFVMENHHQDNSLKCFVFFTFVLLCGSVQWPAGKYGLPKAKSGCPSAIGFQWQTGWRYQDTEDFNPNNYHSTNFHLDASVSKNNLKRHFCMKTDVRNDSGRASWPRGEYCIYKKGSCPSGLTSGWIKWDDEDIRNTNNYGGTIPDGKYDKNTVIYFCCRSDGQKAEPITLPTAAPFFLLAHKSATCQQVKFAISSTEWLRFDTEDTNNQNGYGGKYPYGAGLNDHTMHYCYYTSCKYTLNASTGTFNSPNYPQPYPNGQYCSWRITVRSGIQIVLRFSTFTLQSGSSADNVQVFDGPNESSPSLGVFSGLRSPPTTGVVSSSNDMFVLFKSNGSTNGTGFNATYSSMIITTSGPSTPSTTVTTKSTGTTKASSITTEEHRVTTTGTYVTTTGVTEPPPSVTTAISETPSENSTTSNVSNTGSTSTAETEVTQSSPKVTEVIVTPTEYVTRTSEPIRNGSSHAYQKASDDGGTNPAVIIVPLLVIIGLGIFVFFIYRKRIHSGKDEPGKNHLVFYDSNPEFPSASIHNPLYDVSAKEIDQNEMNPVSTGNGEYASDPLYHTYTASATANPLYGISSDVVTDVYAMPNKERSPAILLNQAHDVMEYENQIYDMHAQTDLENESSA